MPVCQHEATGAQLGGFSRNLVFWRSANTWRNIPASHKMISGDLHENLHAFLNQSGMQLAICLPNREILLFFICFFFHYSSLFWLWFPSRQMSILFRLKHLFSIFYTHIPPVQFDIIHPPSSTSSFFTPSSWSAFQ